MADGLVANHGTIRVRDGGFAALVAPWVENSGEIHATLGRVELAAGEAFTLDFYGDGLIEFDTGSSAVGRHLSHSGEIVADGGAVALTLQETANVLESVINLDGVIQANRIENIGGKIVLRGGADTHVEVSGELLAMGDDQGETGGRIEVLGGTVELASSAVIDASGEAGGGEVPRGRRLPRSANPVLRRGDDDSRRGGRSSERERLGRCGRYRDLGRRKYGISRTRRGLGCRR